MSPRVLALGALSPVHTDLCPDPMALFLPLSHCPWAQLWSLAAWCPFFPLDQRSCRPVPRVATPLLTQRLRTWGHGALGCGQSSWLPAPTPALAALGVNVKGKRSLGGTGWGSSSELGTGRRPAGFCQSRGHGGISCEWPVASAHRCQPHLQSYGPPSKVTWSERPICWIRGDDTEPFWFCRTKPWGL